MLRFMLTALALGLTTTAADATATLDANYAPSSSSTLIVARRLTSAQTFTVQTSGLMTSASVIVGTLTSGNVPNADLTMQIRTLVSGLPSELSSGSTVLASASLSYASVGSSYSWVNFDFADFSVTAGQQLALVMMSATTAGEYAWMGDFAWPTISSASGTYANGRGYDEGASSGGHLMWGDVTLCSSTCNTPSNVDFSFRTYVDSAGSAAVPEPATWTMMIAGFGLVGGAMRRRPRVAFA